MRERHSVGEGYRRFRRVAVGGQSPPALRLTLQPSPDRCPDRQHEQPVAHRRRGPLGDSGVVHGLLAIYLPHRLREGVTSTLTRPVGKPSDCSYRGGTQTSANFTIASQLIGLGCGFAKVQRLGRVGLDEPLTRNLLMSGADIVDYMPEAPPLVKGSR